MCVLIYPCEVISSLCLKTLSGYSVHNLTINLDLKSLTCRHSTVIFLFQQRSQKWRPKQVNNNDDNDNNDKNEHNIKIRKREGYIMICLMFWSCFVHTLKAKTRDIIILHKAGLKYPADKISLSFITVISMSSLVLNI